MGRAVTSKVLNRGYVESCTYEPLQKWDCDGIVLLALQSSEEHAQVELVRKYKTRPSCT